MHRSNRRPVLLVLYAPLLLFIGCRNPFSASQIEAQASPPTFANQSEGPAARLGGAVDFRAQSATNKKRQGTATTGVSMSLDDQLTPEEERTLREAYANATPEIRELARRQLILMKRQRSAPATANKPRLNDSGLIDEDLDENLPTLASTDAPKGSNGDTNIQQVAASTKTNPEDFKMPIPAAPEKPAEEQAEEPAEKSTDAVAAAETSTASEEKAPQPSPDSVASADAAAAEPPSDEPAAPSESTAQPQTAAPPAPAGEGGGIAQWSDKQLLDALVERYRTKAGESTDDVSTLVALRTLLLISGSPDEAVKPVENWKTSEQEFLNYQMLALWQMLDPKAHPVRERRWATALPELKQAVNHLAAAKGTLEVRNLAFCTEVLGYGQTHPFKTSKFPPGQEVLLYVEIEDFVAERLSDGYETHLQGTYEIIDAAGKRVAHQILPPDRQTSSNYRRDYFIPYGLHLPERLPPGNYRMQVTMEDVKGKTYGQSSIPLEIIEPTPSSASR